MANADALNHNSTGVEFYVENVNSSAPMMYSIYDNKTEADASALYSDTIYVREVGPWKVVPR